MHLIGRIIGEIIARTYRLWQMLQSVFEFVWSVFLFLFNLIAWPFKAAWGGLIWLYVNMPWQLFAVLAVIFAFSAVTSTKDGAPLSVSERWARGILIAIAVIAVAISAIVGFILEPLYVSGAISLAVGMVISYKRESRSTPEPGS